MGDAGQNWSYERGKMTVEVVDNVLTLEGENTSYNSAAFVANNLAGKGIKLEEIKEINIIAPTTSSILINTLDVGTIIFPQEVIIKRNDTIITAENASSFAPYIVWNFSRNSEFVMENTTIYGTVLNVAETRGEAIEDGGLVISFKGEALDDGNVGDRIRVKSNDGKHFIATIT